MGAFHLRRFSKPATLKAIEPKALLELLDPYRDFFAGRQLVLPAQADQGQIDFEHLSKVLMSPDVDTPQELATALFFIDEMSTPEGMDALLEELEALDGADLGQDPTPADVAVRCWLANPEALERRHAESLLIRARSFVYFKSASWPPPPIKKLTAARLRALERDLDDWFDSKKRGRGSRVFPFPGQEEISFLVRHGDPFKREGCLDGDDSSSVFYRPEKHDILIYDKTRGELRINARSKGEKDLYCQRFGLHLMGTDNAFNDASRYTLEPLRVDGKQALVCSDIEGLEWVVLKEVSCTWSRNPFEQEIRRADDLFAVLEKRERDLGMYPKLSHARFQVKFSDNKTPRMVTIRVPGGAQYTRDSDPRLGQRPAGEHDRPDRHRSGRRPHGLLPRSRRAAQGDPRHSA